MTLSELSVFFLRGLNIVLSLYFLYIALYISGGVLWTHDLDEVVSALRNYISHWDNAGPFKVGD